MFHLFGFLRDSPFWFHFVHVWKIICRNELCLQRLHSSQELKKRKRKIHLINLIPFLYRPSLTPLPFQPPSKLFALQYVTGNELQDNAILTCFLLVFEFKTPVSKIRLGSLIKKIFLSYMRTFWVSGLWVQKRQGEGGRWTCKRKSGNLDFSSPSALP